MAEVRALTEQPNENFGQRMSRFPARVKEYIEDLKSEMRRVTWPNWKQVRATTTVVIVAVFAFAAYFAVVDLLLGRGVNKIFDALTK
ncbi:MAG: preprotein translocase subunit SecE [Bryobacteraceae bacterium]|nr:preprotein translocase subunit SecE [Bryobacteraceae bacterium]